MDRIETDRIENIDLAGETRRRYMNYALSVITSRALPDVRDGLKPVQRRILYAMRMEGYRAEGRTRKCVGVTGEVTKSYHPHGDEAVYDALVRMAQPWVMRQTLVHGEGNFGNVDGDRAAAKRYTECKLMPLAERLMDELSQRTVDFRPNFDNEKTEPVVLPAQYPNLLVNGSQGIAVGMATNIPPHHLGELVKACLKLIDAEDPEEITVANLVNLQRGPIRGPDFPLGGRMVVEQKALRRIYETGQGSIRVQAEWTLEEPVKRRRRFTTGKNGKAKKADAGPAHRQIVVTSIPYGINKNSLLAAMGEIVENRRLPQALDMVDESTLDHGIRIVVQIKDDADPQAVMAYLFKHTQLQDTFHCNFTCLVPGEGGGDDLRPERLGVKDMLTHFLDFRFATVRRRFEYQLEQLRRRIHVLEGFEIVFDALDEALAIIRRSQGRSDAAEGLRGAFAIDEEQSLAVVDLNLYRIGGLEIDRILEELAEKRAEAERIRTLLASDAALWNVVRGELAAFAEQFPGKRQTRVAEEEEQLEFDPEAYIVAENTNVVVTAGGWLKRVGRLQSAASTRTREGDAVLAVIPASTRDFVVLLASDGVAYTLRAEDVPASSGYGEPVAKFFKLADGARIVAALTTDARFTPTGAPLPPRRSMLFAGDSEWHVLAVTAAGMCLRIPLASFASASTRNGRKYARLADGDEVVHATVPTTDDETIFVAADDGHVIHFRIAEVNRLTNAGKGVKAISLVAGARVIGAHLVSGFRESMQVENTRGTMIDLRRGKYQPVSRGGKGQEVIRRGGLLRVVPPPVEVVDWSPIGEPK